MTNEEKFQAGKVLYKDEDGLYVLELWGASTKHPDSVWFMNNFEMASWVDKSNPQQVDSQVLQWLLEVASRLFLPMQAADLAEWALENWCVWRKD